MTCLVAPLIVLAISICALIISVRTYHRTTGRWW
jgi:hypothetical protein